MNKINQIQFSKFLKIVAIVDEKNSQVQDFLGAISDEGYEIEVTDSYQRDVFEDASVGAYIVSVDGEQGVQAVQLAKAIRATGNQWRVSKVPWYRGLKPRHTD